MIYLVGRKENKREREKNFNLNWKKDIEEKKF